MKAIHHVLTRLEKTIRQRDNAVDAAKLLSKEAREAKDERDEMAQERRTAVQERNDLTIKVVGLEKRLEELQEQLEDAMQWKEAHDKLRKERDALQTQVDAMDEAAEKTEGVVQAELSLQVRLNAANATIVSLTKQRDEANADLNRANETIERKDTLIAGLRRELEARRRLDPPGGPGEEMEQLIEQIQSERGEQHVPEETKQPWTPPAQPDWMYEPRFKRVGCSEPEDDFETMPREEEE